MLIYIYIHIYHICHVIYILPTKLMLLEERDKHISGAQLILLNEKIDKKKTQALANTGQIPPLFLSAGMPPLLRSHSCTHLPKLPSQNLL